MKKYETMVYVIDVNDEKIDFLDELISENYERIKERAGETGNCWSLGGFQKSFNEDKGLSLNNFIYIDVEKLED